MTDDYEQKEECPECGEVYDPFRSGFINGVIEHDNPHERRMDASTWGQVCFSKYGFAHQESGLIFMFVHHEEPITTKANEHQVDGVLE